jgi:archaellum biogenesis ATPase FlaH
MERLSTGVAGLDLILSGGRPSGSLIFIAGGSGTGKTILAQQICFANATRSGTRSSSSTFPACSTPGRRTARWNSAAPR